METAVLLYTAVDSEVSLLLAFHNNCCVIAVNPVCASDAICIVRSNEKPL